MKKKLNLVLRDPVRLNQKDVIVPELPSPFERNFKNEELENGKKIEIVSENAQLKNVNFQENTKQAEIEKTTKISALESGGNREKFSSTLGLREKMSPRIQQIWDYLCMVAARNNPPQKRFSVTRAEIMREAGIGSTNTYRDAIAKFQQLGLLEIELRPGVNSGSVFTFTENGWREVGLDSE